MNHTEEVTRSLCIAELERRGYAIKEIMGVTSPVKDLRVGAAGDAGEFWVDVKGQMTQTSWRGIKTHGP